jgi:hypothetical protein
MNRSKRPAKSQREQYDRALRLTEQQVVAVTLQVHRLHAFWTAPDRRFAESRADFEFLVSALRRLRRAAALAASIPGLAEEMGKALADFDAALPMVRRLRNISEHLDEHVFGPNWWELEYASRGPASFRWLGEEVSFDAAQAASVALLGHLRRCADLVQA